MIHFIIENYSWIFSGIGSGLFFFFLGKRQGYNKAIKQNMKVGDNSNAIQIGGNVRGKVKNE